MTILDDAVALAGVDPRELHTLLAAGIPERTIELARAFEDAGRDAREAYDRGRRAHAAVADGFENDGSPVLDAAAQNDQAWLLLGQGGQDMNDIATLLRRTVGALDDAQATSTRAVNRMVDDLNAVAARSAQTVAPTPAAAAAARQAYLEQAAGIATEQQAGDVLEHFEDVAGLLLGGGMIVLGGTGEVGGFALDATGVGAVAGVPINIAAAGLIATGAGIMAMSAGDLANNAAKNDNQVLEEAQGPSASRGEPGNPLPQSARPDTAGGHWEGRIANSGKGEVWQNPENVNPPRGTPADANSVRIMDADARYPDGYVRFYNEHGQPVKIDGKPGRDRDIETHYPIRPDGSYDVPQGWNP